MAHFIILWKFTEQGLRAVKDSAKRSETYKNSIEKAEGKLVSTYYTLGQYDGVSIVEASDDATIMSSLLSRHLQLRKLL